VPMNKKPSIAVLGCGWYGFALAKNLTAAGYAIKGSTTSGHKLQLLKKAGIEPFLVDFEVGHTQYDPAFFNTDILVVSIPPKRSSPTLINYPDKIESIAKAASNGTSNHVIFISSTGVFQDDNFMADESTIPNPNSESGKVMFAAEKILQQQHSFSTTIIRFAGLIGPDRNLARHFAGKKNISNGLAPINLIHLTDCIGLTKKIIEQNAFGSIYHGVMPDHPARADFYTEACAKTGLEKPEFINERLTWKQINSINVPNFLGYTYAVANSHELAASLISPD
jgi:nucleoside-diphosphate-sugar epimerase